MEEKTKENIDRWEQFNLIIDSENLDIKEKGVLLILFRFVNCKTGYANPSRALIKRLSKISDNRTLDNLLNSLIKKGFLDRKSGKGIRSKYYVKVGGENTLGVKNEPSGKITPRVGGKITPILGGEITPQKENKIKEKKIIYKDLKFIDDVIDKVKVTEDEYKKLIDKYSKELVNKQILALDNYIANGKGQKYKDHYRALNLWCKNEVKHNKEYPTKNLIEEEEKYIIG